MVVTRIGPMSIARISGVLYALMGLVIGGLVSAVSVVGGALSPADSPIGAGGIMAFGAAAVFLFPIMYGVIGFVSALIGAALYNVLAGAVGGIEIDLR